MRVLHVSAGNLFGGVESLLVTLARTSASSSAFQFHFAFTHEGRVHAALREEGSATTLLGEARLSRPASVRRARRSLARVLDAGRFDAMICHAAWPHALFGSVARDLNVPLVLWLHDRVEARHWLWRLARRVRPGFVIANSRYSAAGLDRAFPNVAHEVVHCPVQMDSTPPRPRDEVRRELDTPGDAVVLVQTSRMEEWKGHGTHLRALGRLRNRKDWVCWIAGGAQRPAEAEYLRELQGLAEQLGIADRVRFLGHRDDVRDLLGAADIHCQPNLRPEPFGIAFVEALAACRPVVTTALGGALEIVTERCGVLVPPGDDEALSAALERLIDNAELRRALGTAGPERAREVSAPGPILDKLRRILEPLRPPQRGETIGVPTGTGSS